MTDTISIPLDPPLARNGGVLASLDLREPTAGEVLTCEMLMRESINSLTTRQAQLNLVASIIGVRDMSVLAALPISKLNDAAKWLWDHITYGLDPPIDREAMLTIPLDSPIQADGFMITMLELHEPTAGQVRDAETNVANGWNIYATRAYQIKLVSGAAGIPYQAALKLPIRALNKASVYLQSFVLAGPPTGGSLSPS